MSTTAATYFGATVGRYANRIGGAAFTLDRIEYRLPANDGTSSLHGGPVGFDRRVGTAVPSEDSASAELRYTSADGEMGYPGTLAVRVIYTLAGDTLRIDYETMTDRTDRIGRGHAARLPQARTDRPANPRRSPSTRLRPRLQPQLRARPRGGGGSLVTAARVWEPTSGRVLEVETTEPGVQLYSGNMLDGTLVGTSGRAYRRSDGFALETQHFPDSPNRPTFPSTVLRPGERFTSTTTYRLTTSGDGIAV